METPLLAQRNAIYIENLAIAGVVASMAGSWIVLNGREMALCYNNIFFIFAHESTLVIGNGFNTRYTLPAQCSLLPTRNRD
jgi:hypothetical protein